MSVSVIIPTLNAEREICGLIENLQNQSRKPDEIIVIDSSSDDRTAEIVRQMDGIIFLQIDRKDFDHGGTRDLAFRKSAGDYVLFLTQDAVPQNEDYIKNLMAPFEDPDVAAVGGRQIAKKNAKLYETEVRRFNYPDKDRIWSAKDRAKYGIKTYMISDSCSAYRRTSYLDVDGFDSPILTNEDMLICAKLLDKGYKLAYSSKACVYHSHNYTLKQEYKRNYIVGKTLKHYEERFKCTSETNEGISLVKQVSKRLISKGHVLSWVEFVFDCAARFLGNRMGRRSEK